MNIPIWALVSMVIMLFNAGLAMGYYGSRFVTHGVCRQRRDDCEKIREKERTDELENRRKAWTKIDFLYERELSRSGPLAG